MALGATVALTVALAWLAVAVGTGCVDAVGRLTRREPAAPPRRRGGVPALACALVLAAASQATAAAGEPTPPTAPPAASPATTGAATPAAASPAPVPGPSATPVPGWVPQVSRVPPAVTALVTSAAPAGSPEPGPAPHVVVTGDTLWGIAAAHLGADATAAEIASQWPRWWRANHAVVGDDPDLLRPGQVLHPPPPGD
jgi:nucleoid-associated protein YgaU